MRLTCPHCGRSGSVPDGQPLPARAKCPGCKTTFDPRGVAVADPPPFVPPLEEQLPATWAGGQAPMVVPPQPIEPRVIDVTPAAVPARACDFCGESIQPAAKKCRHCGEILDPVLRAAEEARRLATRPAQVAAPPVIIHNTNDNRSSASSSARATSTARSVVSRAASGCGCLVALAIGLFVLLVALAPKPSSNPPPSRPVAPASRPRQASVVESPAPQPELQPEPEPGPKAKVVAAPKGPTASTLLKMGRNVDSLNPKAAAGYFREVIEKFPGTPEATEAAERLKVLEAASGPTR